jgi:hypothetical protein
MLKMEIPTEMQEQRWLVKWLSAHSQLKNYFFKIHNEGQRSAGQTWNLKLMGLRSGVSDLFIYFPTKKYHGLFLEVKRNMHYPPSVQKNKTWVAQQEFAKTVKIVGYEAKTCYGWEDGKKIIEAYLAE